MKTGFFIGLALAILSGLLAWPMSELGQWLAPRIDLPFSDWQTILIGLTFGALVMARFCSASSLKLLRRVLMCIASILIYMLATRLAIHEFYLEMLSSELSMVMAGATGGLLVGIAVSFFGGYRPRFQHWLLTMLAGSLGGIPFALFIFGTSEWLTVLCFVAWQSLVYCALFYSHNARQSA